MIMRTFLLFLCFNIYSLNRCETCMLSSSHAQLSRSWTYHVGININKADETDFWLFISYPVWQTLMTADFFNNQNIPYWAHITLNIHLNSFVFINTLFMSIVYPNLFRRKKLLWLKVEKNWFSASDII